MGGPQQLYHLDTYIPLQINCDESKAAFHQKRKVPGGLGFGEARNRGRPRLLDLRMEGVGGWTPESPESSESSLRFLSPAIDGGDAPSVSAFLTGCLPVLLC